MKTSATQNLCISTVVTDKGIEALLEVSNQGGQGSYRDDHPWLIAKELLDAAEQELPILFATQSATGVYFSYWSVIRAIDVVQLHRGQWESRCHFDELRPMNPIWEPIDSVYLPTHPLQLARESLEQIRESRTALDEHHIHPYAICETPVFIQEVLTAKV